MLIFFDYAAMTCFACFHITPRAIARRHSPPRFFRLDAAPCRFA